MNFIKKKYEHHISNKNKVRKTITNILLISALLFVTTIINAQAVQSNLINYQGIARDAGGEILIEQAITIDIELLFGAPNIPATYAETHNVNTDASGVFNLKIGDGTPTLGDYSTLDWNGFAPYVTVSLNGAEIGTTEMHAVPFALSSGDKLWFPSGGGTDAIYYSFGNVGIGTTDPEEDLHVAGSALVQSNLGTLKIGFPNNGNQWQLATIGSGADLNFRSKPDGSESSTSRFTLKQNGHVGIGINDPDEELVIGTNLGSGWAIPAATVGNASGGAIEVGNPTTNFSISASSTFDRARLVASDANGFGQGIVEMRTRQLNIGTAPGIGASPYAVRIVQPSVFGLQLISSSDETKNWELFASVTGNLSLYSGVGLAGNFDETSGNYSPTSDKRLKTNINPAQNVLNKVIQLDAKSYNYKTNLNKRYVGFLAQDVQAQFSEVVTETADRTGEGESTLLVDYSQLTVIALKAIKEQQQIIETLKARIEVLENN